MWTKPDIFFWGGGKKMPKRSYIHKEAKTMPGSRTFQGQSDFVGWKHRGIQV